MGLDPNINVGYQGHESMHIGRPRSRVHERQLVFMYSRSRPIIHTKMVGMMHEYKTLLLLVQALHDPGFRSNKLGSRDTELHQLGKRGSEATNKPGC